MEKASYFVSVQAGTVMHNQGDAAYEFEIIATEEEVEKLRELFEDQMEVDQTAFFRAHTPAIPYHHDQVNDDTDALLQSIYSMIYDLGTDETKRHLQSMNVVGTSR